MTGRPEAGFAANAVVAGSRRPGACALAGSRPARMIFAAVLAAGAAHADEERGFVLYQQHCRTCHVLAPGDHRLGPSLHDVVGSVAGSAAGFRFSRTMAGAGFVWDEGTLDAFLKDPGGFMPGNAMLYLGMADAADRTALIEYLADQ